MNPSEALREAADALDKRLRVLTIPRTRVAPWEWNEYNARFPGVIPTWYRELLREFSFVDVFLWVPHYHGASWGCMCSLRGPSQKTFSIEDDERIVPYGWFPFAEEADGNFWAIRADAPIDSPVILINQSEGGFGASGGVIYAAHCLAHLLSVAAISNARIQDLTADGFVDATKAGFKLWGDQDAYMAKHQIRTLAELKTAAIRSRSEADETHRVAKVEDMGAH
jgi:hypothetical protein